MSTYFDGMHTPPLDAPAQTEGPASLEEFLRLLHQDPPKSSTATIDEVVQGIRRDRDSAND